MIIDTHPTITTPAYDKNPGDKMKYLMSWMVDTEDCSGAFMTITTEPTIHMKQPILPMKERRSLRNMDERIAVMTTDCYLVSECQGHEVKEGETYKSTQRRDQDSFNKSICAEITDLPKNHYSTPSLVLAIHPSCKKSLGETNSISSHSTTTHS